MFLHLSKYSNSKSLTFFGSCYVFYPSTYGQRRGQRAGDLHAARKPVLQVASTKMKSIELMVLDNVGCNFWNSAISYFSTVHPLYHGGDLRLSLLCRC